MQGEVFAVDCPLPGKRAEVTMGFVAPTVLQAPVAASIRAPVGYALTWDCNFDANQLLLPGGRNLDYLQVTDMKDCVVSPDGRSANFTILQNIKAISSWTFFTIKVVNPAVHSLPATQEQSSWSLVVGGFAAAGGGRGGVKEGSGMQSPALQVFSQMELQELPFTYSNTTWALKLRFRSFSAVPSGGYVIVSSPTGFGFPEAQCRTADANYTEMPGSPQYVPMLPVQPFRRMPDPESAASRFGPEPEVKLSADCEVRPGEGGREQLLVSMQEGELPPGIYELRFVVNISNSYGSTLKNNVAEPMAWSLESWRPLEDNCLGSCCAEKRENFRPIVGLSLIEQLDTGVLMARLPGTFRHRQLVFDSAGSWQFSNTG
eukprot:TRINITY_DN49156_c0_g1_i1.p1 TRINITY_DN49156_c0_g1~~TRINITY_DN49156_c0_g1_i1.p1  ORF type:complete len:423 (+),score=93.47 TRINITY_DN49156_c0_g1_i1:149-1270(+)